MIGLFEVAQGNVTCLDSTRNFLFLGTDVGRVYKYRIEPDDAAGGAATRNAEPSVDDEERRENTRYLSYVEIDKVCLDLHILSCGMRPHNTAIPLLQAPVD